MAAHTVRRLATFGAVSTVVFATLAGPMPAQAVHTDGLFELDVSGTPPVPNANTANSGAAGDDWDQVYAGTSNALETAFIEDTVGPAEVSYFDGGGSKDVNDISGTQQHWEWDNAQDVVPDKDDIVDAFAAEYVNPSDGHTHFYFGLDLFDGNGDASAGFWFFREPVTLGTPPVGSANGQFNGKHSVGDILVVVDLRSGGQGISEEVHVYRWVGGNDPLDQLFPPPGNPNADASCATVAAGDDACAVFNTSLGENPPWGYTNKDGGSTYAAQATLIEGGIDLTGLTGLTEVGCFSSFLAETRSSHSEDAQLKDFALGAFPVCGIEVDKTGDTLSKVGDPVTYTITPHNTGRATLYKRNISDSLLGNIAVNGVNVNPNGYITSNTCGASLAPDDGAPGGPDQCTITAVRTVQPGDPDPLPNTVSILYSEKADFTGLEFSAQDDHEVNLFQPAVMIAKTGGELSKVGDDVTYDFTITNMSSEDSPDLELASINDNVIGDLSAEATAAGCDVLTFEEECSFQVSRTIQASDPDPLVNTVDVLYHPDGFPNDITASDSHSVNLFQPSVSIEKDGDDLSKIGDDVTYDFTITNTSSADSPALVLDSLNDDVLGDLSDEAPASCDSLAPGASCSFSVPWTVAAVDINPADGQADDPVINTVTVHFHPDGFPNDITATASHELNLFQPSIAFEKTADTELSKATDTVNYTLTLNNTSSADSPDLECLITDAQLGVGETVTLASGEGHVISVPYVVQAGDPDPLVNTALVSCSPIGFPNVLEAQDSWTVNLFQPSIDVVKDGDTLSKVGDPVTYTFTVRNTSSADSPNLMLDSFTDSLLGNLFTTAEIADCDNLAPGGDCQFTFTRNVAALDPDPLPNTVVVHYHPVGFPNDITDSDDHEVNLFQPSITFDKSADTELSKVGDQVNYTLTLNNTSSADSPDLECTITDALLGVNKNVTLASGATDVTNVPYTVQAGDPDPLVNTADVSCSPEGFPNILLADDSWTVNLFQPALDVTKSGPPFTKEGDTASYTVTITNNSSADAPDLVIDTISDTLVGDLKDAGNTAVTGNTCAPAYQLASGGSCEITYDYVVADGSGATLSNTVSVETHPVDFPNDVDDSATHEATLLHPAFTVAKECTSTQPVDQSGPAVFTVTFTNTGDADLVVNAVEGGAYNVPVGGSHNYAVTVNGPFTGQATVGNTESGTVTLDSRYGLPNSYNFEASATCAVGGRVSLLKLTEGVQDPSMVWTFNLYEGPDGFGSTVLASDSTPPAQLDFGNINLDPAKTYTVCEENVPAGWTSMWKVDTDNDGIPDTIVPAYNPNADDPVPSDVGNRCFDFGAGTDYPVPAGGTLAFEVDNDFPGGEPRTPGYWKNWNYCTGGNQTKTAEKNGGPAAGWFTLDDLLNNPGFLIGDMILNGVWDDDQFKFDSAKHNDCIEAVRILDKSDAKTGKKAANDAAYELATALFAAKLNLAAGAETCTAVQTAVNDGQTLLDQINFKGTGSYLPSKGGNQTLRAQALALAKTLDNYNNGNLC